MQKVPHKERHYPRSCLHAYKNMLWRNFEEIRSCRFEPWWSLVFPTVAFSQLCNAEAFNIGLENCPSPLTIGNWDRPGFRILVGFLSILCLLRLVVVSKKNMSQGNGWAWRQLWWWWLSFWSPLPSSSQPNSISSQCVDTNTPSKILHTIAIPFMEWLC